VLQVAQQMNAKHLLMTHFSQRYPKIPILKNTPITSHTAIAFDHMEVYKPYSPDTRYIEPKTAIVGLFCLTTGNAMNLITILLLFYLQHEWFWLQYFIHLLKRKVMQNSAFKRFVSTSLFT